VGRQDGHPFILEAEAARPRQGDDLAGILGVEEATETTEDIAATGGLTERQGPGIRPDAALAAELLVDRRENGIARREWPDLTAARVDRRRRRLQLEVPVRRIRELRVGDDRGDVTLEIPDVGQPEHVG